MINKNLFRQHFEDLVEQLKPRNIDKQFLLKIKNLDSDSLNITKDINNLNHQKGVLISEKNLNHQTAIRSLKDEIQQKTQHLKVVNDELEELISLVPNIPSSDLTEEQKIIYSKNKIKSFDFKALSHVELAEKLSLISFNDAVNMSGSGFAIYTGFGDKLYRALIAFTLDENEKKGYIRHYMPEIINEDSLYNTSQISKFSEQLFKIEDGKYLSPTGEVQLVNMYKNKIIPYNLLPIKLTTHTNCFRNEKIAAGAHNKGIIRMYQFSKTEIVTICKEENSAEILEQMCLDAEDILNQLNLPYRKVLLANNDIGFSASKTYDLEVWLPSEQQYREISSISNTLDFQSRRGKIRWKTRVLDTKEKAQYTHILNGSSIAIDRLFAAILENYQDVNGDIAVPEALKKYSNFSKTINY